MILHTGQFKRDYKLAKRQGKNLDDLRSVIETLAQRVPLPAQHKDHPLSGRWHNHRECHVTADWLLIYCRRGDDLILERIGSHSELFKK